MDRNFDLMIAAAHNLILDVEGKTLEGRRWKEEQVAGNCSKLEQLEDDEERRDYY